MHSSFRDNFTRPAELEKSLRRVDTLINNYWVRFDHPPQFTFAKAIANSKVLLDAAKRAGVRRVVHVSITNPECKSDLPYFSGKAEVEAYLRSTGMSYSILRPAVLFGKEDILINNIAWADADTSPPPIPADLRRRLCRMRNEGGDARSNRARSYARR
jgi:nucleoside-diphosphate-sugar epimerase